MLVLRLFVVLLALFLASLLVAWLFTREQRYLRLAGQVLKFCFFLFVIGSLFFVVERVIFR
jgi:hypothetical protein